MFQIRQLFHLLRVLRLPGALRAFRTWKPFSITSFEMLHRLRQQGLSVRTIVDGGANVGQFARAALGFFPDARLIAFEPLPDVAETLRANLADCPRAKVVASALGETDGTLTFHRTTYSLSSSALPLHDNQAQHFPQVRPEATIEVPVGRLDTLLQAMPLTAPVLLKLDLQGFEIPALKGAGALLDQVDYLLVEASFEPMYEGEPLFDELYDFLRARGFRLVRPLGVLAGDQHTIVQMDALFARAV